jgi:dienelactone hydrolase
MTETLPQPESTIGITANGVPYVALPPAGGQQAAAVLALWHGGDPPRTDAALVEAIPLNDIPAWRFYLGLPLTGRRLPPGGMDELMARGAQDAIPLTFHPIVSGAVREFPAALADLRSRFGIAHDVPLGLFGFSMGGSTALMTAIRQATSEAPVKSVFTFGAALDFHDLVDYLSRIYGTTYPWNDERVQLAEEISPVNHIEELARSHTRFHLAVGSQDPYPMQEGTLHLASAIREHGGAAEVEIVPDLAHAFAPDPDAPNQGTPADAAKVEDLVRRWFKQQF